MVRRIALVVACVCALGAFAPLGPAAAVAPPPADGTLSCFITGSAEMTPPLPVLSADAGTKAGKIQAKKSAITDCDATGVTGGKAGITGGTSDLKALTAPGGSCQQLGDVAFGGVPVDPTAQPLIKPSVKVKLTGTGPTGRPTTVATLTVENVAMTQGTLGFALTGTVKGTPGRNAFAGRTVTTNISPTNILELLGCMYGNPDPAVRSAISALLSPYGITPTVAPLGQFMYSSAGFLGIIPPSTITIT